MTPAVAALKKAKVAHQVLEYEHDADNRHFGMEAANKLGLEPACVFKTLLVSLNGDAKSLGVAIIPVDKQLDLKAIAKALGAKKAAMADPKIAERVTGYIVGGISPLGQKRLLPTVLDESGLGFDTVYVSGGKRGMDIGLAPQDLITQCKGKAHAIAR